MPNTQKDFLIALIKSLSKAEKRNFKLFTNRYSGNEDAKFLQLFDFIEKTNDFSEVELLEKVPSIKKSQLSNLKAHLYKQILSSLRLLQVSQDIDVECRDLLDHATILYKRGLYQQAMKVLKKAKQRAEFTERSFLLFEILEFEKKIELQFVAQNINDSPHQLAVESQKVINNVAMTSRLSVLSLRLYEIYLKKGYIRNKRDHESIKTFFFSQIPEVELSSLGFHEKLQYYTTYVWYYFIIQDFVHSYRYAQKWVDLFEEHPDQKIYETEYYLKGKHILLIALFNLRYYDKFLSELEDFENIATPSLKSENYIMLHGLYGNINQINRIFLEGSFDRGVNMVEDIETFIKKYEGQLHKNRIIVLYYKIACMYFGNGENKKSIFYLNKVVNSGEIDLRHDIQCFSRILRLIAYFELGDNDLVDYQVKSVYRFLKKMNDLQKVQIEIMKFIRNLPKIVPGDLKKEFVKLHQSLTEISMDPFEKRPFLYLDIISWLESKINGVPVKDVIQEKFKEERRSGNVNYFPVKKPNKPSGAVKKS